METINIPSRVFSGTCHTYRQKRYCLFNKNLETLLIACKLLDYHFNDGGTTYQFTLDDSITYWENRKESLFLSYINSFEHRKYFHIKLIIKGIIETNTKQEIMNMAWAVEYFLINGYNMRTVNINDVYDIWKKELHYLFGDMTYDKLKPIKEMDVVTK